MTKSKNSQPRTERFTTREQERIKKQLSQPLNNGFNVQQDEFNVWDRDFGWILKDGKPTENSKPYWAAMRRKTEK